MSELSSSDKARLKESYPGLYVVVLNFEDMRILRNIEHDYITKAHRFPGENQLKRDLVKHMIKDAES